MIVQRVARPGPRVFRLFEFRVYPAHGELAEPNERGGVQGLLTPFDRLRVSGQELVFG